MNVQCFAITFLLTLALLSSVPAQTPSTVAESSNFTATSRYSDVIEFVHALQEQSSQIRVETLCTSAEGRKVPLLVIGNPAPASPADLRSDGRTAVYFQANIHAGEVEGKEAVLMLARDILQAKTANYLDKLVILLVPIFNADGNEKISTENRPRQVGPEQGVGIRYNGQNLDLNRDGMKLETPEVQGLVQNVLLRWDPVFFLDAHTHNGSYHQEPVTWTWGLNPNGDSALFDYFTDRMWPAVERLMREKHNIPTIPHGDFLDPAEPEKGWIPLGPQPRYLSNYVGLRNRLSVLNENYPYADYKTRVLGCYKLLLSFLDVLHSNRDEITRLTREADQRTIQKGLDPSANGTFTVEYDRKPIEQTFTIQGYKMEVEPREGGWPRVTKTDQAHTYSGVPYYAKYTSTRTVRLPRGYLIPVQDREVIEKLVQHGILVERLVEPAELTVEAFNVTEVQSSDALNQGHHPNRITGEYSEKKVSFPAGTYYVRMAQALANVASSLLEPESDDGLAFWNFLDRHLARQWRRGPVEYPVYKLHQQVHLVKETVR
jgi:hypothetical protein